MAYEERDNSWYCPECNHVLGEVVGGEFKGIDQIPASAYETRGANLKVTCPECGRVKIWYTSDTIVRAVYQLVNAVAGESAKIFVREGAKRIRNIQNHEE